MNPLVFDCEEWHCHIPGMPAKEIWCRLFSIYQIEAFISLPHLQLIHLDSECYLLFSFLNLFTSGLAEELAKCHVHIDLLKKKKKENECDWISSSAGIYLWCRWTLLCYKITGSFKITHFSYTFFSPAAKNLVFKGDRRNTGIENCGEHDIHCKRPVKQIN